LGAVAHSTIEETMVRILRDPEVEALLDRRELVERLEDGYRADAVGETTLLPRSRGELGDRTLAFLGASVGPTDRIAWRSYLYSASGEDRGHQVVALYRRSTMELETLFLGTAIGVLRTGGSMIAAVRFAQPRLRRLGLLGTGRQARSALASAAATLPLEQVTVWSPSATHREEFGAWARTNLGRTVELARGPAEVARASEAILLATSAEETVLTDEMLPDPRLLVSLSAYRRPELAATLVDRSRWLWTDSVEQAGRGPVFAAEPRRGKLRPVADPGCLEALRDEGATRLVVNTGAAWQELVLAATVSAAAEAAGVGDVVPIPADHSA
jgi:alanine dehydrogenase